MAKRTIFVRPAWWEARSVRERRMLVFAAVLLAGVLIWLAVIRPLIDARTRAEARLDAAIAELAKARADASALKQQAAASAANPVPSPLDAFLAQSATEQGLTTITVAASAPNRASISSAQVRPPAFFGWIAQLESRGLAIESLSARANSDQTIAVDAVLRAGGR